MSRATQVWGETASDAPKRQLMPLCEQHGAQIKEALADAEVRKDLRAHNQVFVLLTSSEVAGLKREDRKRLKKCVGCANPETWAQQFEKHAARGAK